MGACEVGEDGRCRTAADGVGGRAKLKSERGWRARESLGHWCSWARARRGVGAA